MPELDAVQLVTFVVILGIVSLVAGLLALGSLEVDRWRIVIQGVTMPGLLVTVMTATTEKMPAARVAGTTVPAVTGEAPAGAPAVTSSVGFSLVASAYAQAPKPTAGPNGTAPMGPETIDPPGFLARVAWGVKGAAGRYPANWCVEVGRFSTAAQANARAREMDTVGLRGVAVYELCFGGDDGNAWVPCRSHRAVLHREYAILLGAEVSPQEASHLQGVADEAGLVATVWQRPQPVAGSPSSPQRLGAHVARQRGDGLEIVVDASYAASHPGAVWLLLDVAVSAGAGRPTTLDRNGFVLLSPGGDRVSLATQAALGDDAGRVAQGLRALKVASGAPTEYLEGRREDCEWFLIEPGTGLTVETLSVKPGAICTGFLAFPVPAGAASGTWRLQYEAPTCRFDVPFEID